MEFDSQKFLDYCKELEETYSENYVYEELKKIQYEISEMCKEEKMKWIIQAIGHLDLTSLNPDDSYEVIKNLCSKAVDPMNKDEEFSSLHTASICIHPTKVKLAVGIFEKYKIKEIKIASVGAGFPTGKFPLAERLEEIKKAVESGADEIDVVIDRDLVTNKKWPELYNELCEMRKACGNKTMKTILSTGDLGSMVNVFIVSMLAIKAGTDFIKTSTGKEKVNAIIPTGIVMCAAIKETFKKTGKKVGLKPAGGIKTTFSVLKWMMLIRTQFGEDWLTPDLFRIGASSVLDELVKTYYTLKSQPEDEEDTVF